MITQVIDKHLIGTNGHAVTARTTRLACRYGVITGPNGTLRSIGSNKVAVERVTGIEPALSAWELQGSWLVMAIACS